jgi:tRNA nucleotidyltransferase (CCA-adding enzyme)
VERIVIPNAASLIINRLEERGFEAYVVGGCVRDSIMGITPHDWDICTSAIPEQIIEVFSDLKVIPTGLKHGTVTVVVDDCEFEITTYRIDGEYRDNRHPETVEFVQDLKLDLMRRDFTINAMAYNDRKGIIDYFGGVSDIKNGTIKCVGSPNDRFAEDALRIMRAIRFAARFQFEIEENTRAAMLEHAELLTNVSAERVNSEIAKTLEAVQLKEQILDDMIQVLAHVIPEFYNLTRDESNSIVRRVSNYLTYYKSRISLRLALLLNFENEEIEKILRRLKFSNEISNNVLATVKYGRMILNGKYFTDGYVNSIEERKSNKSYLMYGVKRLLCDIGCSRATKAIVYAMICADQDSDQRKNLDDFGDMFLEYTTSGCNATKVTDLKVNGNDLLEIGFKGKEIGKTLNTLLDMVFREIIQNDKDQLLCAAKSIKEYLLCFAITAEY